jgi:hypothetical protein
LLFVSRQTIEKKKAMTRTYDAKKTSLNVEMVKIDA